MRIVMEYTWQGIQAGCRGTVLDAHHAGKQGLILNVKFDYGETRKVPKMVTVPEKLYDDNQIQLKDF